MSFSIKVKEEPVQNRDKEVQVISSTNAAQSASIMSILAVRKALKAALESSCQHPTSSKSQEKQIPVGTSKRKSSIPIKNVKSSSSKDTKFETVKVKEEQVNIVTTPDIASVLPQNSNTGKPRLTVEEKARILELHEQGNSNGHISREMNCSKSTIARWLHRWKTEGHVWVRSVNGRPRVTTAQQDANIIAVLNSDNGVTSKNIQQQLNINASRRTIIRRLGEAGLYGQWTNKKDFVKENQRILRLSFAKEYITYPLEFWKKMIFTDTYVISLTQNGKITMHRPYEINHHVPTYINAEIFSVYIWGWMSVEGICDLWQLEGIFSCKQYRSILRDKMIPTCYSKSNSEDIYLIQDRTPIQISRLAKEWCNKSRVKVLNWPTRAADLKPIEKACLEIKQILQTSVIPPTTQQELSQQIELAWNTLMSSPGFIQSLILDVPLRLASIIANNGDLT